MPLDTQSAYDHLASHYHLMFEDWNTSIARQAAALAPVLRRECTQPGPVRVLDCACGIGTQALGLALAGGFQVSACDLSSASVARLRAEAELRNVDVSPAQADMRDLSGFADGAFDAVICMDNALPHLETAADVSRALSQMHLKLRPGGLLAASTRDYDQLVLERPVHHGPSFFSDDGRRRIVFQVWDWLDERTYTFHLYITWETASGWETHHTAASYHTRLRGELSALLRQAGFVEDRWVFPEQSGFYQPVVLARTPSVK